MKKSALASLLFICACDNSQAIHRMTPSWDRMQTQARAESYGESFVFADDRAMRTPPPGTMPRNALDVPEDLSDAGPGTIPIAVDVQMIERGRASFESFCAACHGVRGDGESVVASKMQQRRPPSFHEARLVHLSDRDIARVIREGYGFMPSYASLLEPRARWEVIAYVRALQASYVPASTLSVDAQHALEAAK